MIPREHLATWLGVSEGRVSQMIHSLVNTWSLVERRGKRGNVRYTLSAEGIRYITHRDRAELPTTQGHLEHGPHHRPPGPEAITWDTASRRGRGRRSTQTASRGSSRSWRRRPRPTPTARLAVVRPHRQGRPHLQLGGFSHRPRRGGTDDSPSGLHVPFYFEYELRARHARGVLVRLRPLRELLLVATSIRKTSRRSPQRCSSLARRRSRTTYVNTAVPDEPNVTAHPGVLHPRPVSTQESWEGHGVHCGNSDVPEAVPVRAERAYQWDSVSTTGCVTVIL